MLGNMKPATMQQIEKVRSITDKKIRAKQKALLPVFYPSGVLEGSKEDDSLAIHSGLLVIDIDEMPTEGPCEGFTPDKLRDWLWYNYENIAFSALSVSLKGVFAVVPIAYPDKHQSHAQQIIADMQQIGIKLDTKCTNLARARFISYDPNAKINPDAVPYTRLPKKKVVKYVPRTTHTDLFEWYVHRAIDQRLSLCNDYDTWYKMMDSILKGMSYSAEAHNAIHAISSLSDGYDQKSTDQKIRALTAKPLGKVTPGTFIYHCKQNGLDHKDSKDFTSSPKVRFK
jgi:hypothetical protein